MQNKAKTEKKSAPATEGVKGGLRIWLFFLLGFYSVGYSDQLSMALAVIGGLAGGLMVAWGYITDEPSQIDTPLVTKRKTLAQAALARAAKKPLFRGAKGTSQRRGHANAPTLLGKKNRAR